jgi:glycosyltransferase involved in cell wall biosynthesis
VSVVIPCLDEAETIAECVTRARRVLEESGLRGEVIVVDNGSTDGSGQLARAAGAIVVEEPRRGYGSAYLAGLDVAGGDNIVMVDADLTYDFGEIPHFVTELQHGAQLVVGNRMQNIQPGAMPFLSRVGNPLLSGFLNVLHRTNVRDVHCGMRALRREVLPALNLRTVGMEFASEMVIRATRERLDVREIPIELHPRVGRSKLSPFRDGWRHLRVILVYNPTFLFLVPGVAMFLAGSLITLLVFAHVPVFGRNLYVHSLILGSLLIILGVQAVGLGLCARAFGVYFISEQDPLFQALRARLRLEHGLALALVVVAAGLALVGLVLAHWAENGFGRLKEVRLAILAATVITVGAQVFFTSFLISILGLRRRRGDE